MITQTQLITAEELERIPQNDAHVELVKGAIVKMPPAGHEHGEVALAIGSLIRDFVRRNKLGKTYGAETGFILSRNPDTVRAPDAAFVSTARAAQQTRRTGFFDGAPDLAVEVVSPEDTVGEIDAKVIEYLEAGVRLVWILHPRTRTITVYRSLDDVRVLTANDSLDGGNVLPDFTVSVKEIFEG
ncbi:MAG: Uma2 family endonuclease [Chloroflexi bacterium]|nr:Uma2 family endonuclease [Chloroflexota bacterium]